MAELTAAERAAPPERLVSRWVEAFNARDLDGMLACLSREVDLHPLRLGGLEVCYRGHEGVCRWFAQLQHRRHDHAISLSEVRDLGDGRVFAGGCLSATSATDACLPAVA